MTGVLESVRLLAQLAMRESGADAFTLYAIDSGSGVRVEQCSSGVTVPDPTGNGFEVVAFSLHTERKVAARLVFGFRGKEVPAPSRIALGQVVSAIESVWEFSRFTTAYARLGERLGALEEELASSKIADRARGLLAKRSSEDPIKMILLHVEGVARKVQSGTALAKLLEEMEDELTLRKLAGQAKTVLQNDHGMSEEEAHIHLRLTSRRSRKSVKDVARELINARRPAGLRSLKET